MKKFLKLMTVSLVIFGLMLSLVGCGGEEATTGGESGKDEKVYLVGTEPTFPPFEMTNEQGEIIGFDIDLIKAIAEEEGFKVEIKKLGFEALIPALKSGNIDIIASGMSITDERKKSVDFSDPYIDASLRIAVADDNNEINSVEDLEGKVAAAQMGTTGYNKAEELVEKGLLKDVKTFKTVNEVFMELINGGVDCVINDAPVTKAYMAIHEGKIKMVGEPLVGDEYGFAVAKDSGELLSKINSGLKKLKEDGTYDKLIEKYFAQ